MQMIYLLHSQMDPELVARLQRRFGGYFGTPRSPEPEPEGGEAGRAPALARTPLEITELEILQDLHFGRAA